MTFESMLTKMGTGVKQITDRYAEYGAPVQEQQYFYTYEPQSHGIPEAASKHTYGGGGHKSNAAMSALTLLAFLFFLHILQQCIRDHMDAMTTPQQITIMAAGREGEVALKKGDAKIDKTGLTDSDIEPENKHENVIKNDDSKYLMKINTAQPPRYSNQNYNALMKYGDRRIDTKK